jgi:hypothetical protein
MQSLEKYYTQFFLSLLLYEKSFLLFNEGYQLLLIFGEFVVDKLTIFGGKKIELNIAFRRSFAKQNLEKCRAEAFLF